MILYQIINYFYLLQKENSTFRLNFLINVIVSALIVEANLVVKCRSTQLFFLTQETFHIVKNIKYMCQLNSFFKAQKFYLLCYESDYQNFKKGVQLEKIISSSLIFVQIQSILHKY